MNRIEGVGKIKFSNWLRPTGWHVGLLLIVVGLLSGCGDELPVVDLSQAAENEVSPVEVNPSQDVPLRVVVGAMMSPEITREYYQELIELIAERTGHRVEFLQRRTCSEVNQLVRRREVDVAFVCAGPYTCGKEKFGMELLAVPVSHGRSVCYSYILAHRDSAVESFVDFRGKRFAFTDPSSNTGYLVPTYMLARMGETPESFFSESFCTQSHDNSIEAVADGLVDGAAVDSLIWEFMNSINPVHTSRTKIIAKSPPYGISPVVVHPDMDENLKQQFKAAFLSIHEDPAAVPLLKRIQIDRFAEGDDAMYDSVREMRHWLEERDLETNQ